MLLSSFATIAAPNAFADGIVARVALLTALKLLRSCYCNCYAGVATPTSSFATIATANAFADASVARVAILTTAIVRTLLLPFLKV